VGRAPPRGAELARLSNNLRFDASWAIFSSEYFAMRIAVAALAGFALVGSCVGAGAQGASTLWVVKKTKWEIQNEQGYSEFVATLGKAVEARKCNSLSTCLHNKDANPLYFAALPPDMTFHADCADLPYVIRAFYAWRYNLPLSYVFQVGPRSAIDPNKDLRYTLNGNVVEVRKTVFSTPSKPVTFGALKDEIIEMVSSDTYRILDRAGEPSSDFYSPAINRQNIVPGTVIYDPNGHVALVYRVTDDGNVFFIDAHPDNSLTSGTFGMKFVRSRPDQSAGFKKWRPINLENTTAGSDGSITAGKVKVAADSEISGFSTEQYWGNTEPKAAEWSKGQFKINGEQVDWYSFVRSKLTVAGSKRDPIAEIKGLVDSLCSDLRYRGDAVDLAIKAGIDKKDHPERLPANIYGSAGEWEDYSTPSRDARTKTSFVELRERFDALLADFAQQPHAFTYQGSNLKLDLSKAYNAAAAACSVGYRNSAGKTVTLSYAELQRRLFKMSFDPYHCPELRWGASAAGELASCPVSDKKQRWYDAEQRLRNQVDRKYEDVMNFSVEQLKAKAPGSGVDEPPPVSVGLSES
jgi:hypothetical protein